MDPFIRDFTENYYETKYMISSKDIYEFLGREGDTLSLYHMNVRSLNKNFDEFCVYLSL